MSFLKKARQAVLGINADELTVQAAGVEDELAGAGKAFGKLLVNVGIAVAETQRQLDANGAAIASLMASTDVDIIRARETLYDDEGEAKDIVLIPRPGRLIELAAPVFYEHKFVQLQGEFTAKELATSLTSKSRTFGASASASFGKQKGKSGKASKSTGSAGIAVSGGTSSATSGSTFDQSVGAMRMNALVAPKDYSVIPAPVYILEGPTISITSGNVTVSATSGDRLTTVTFVVKKRDGSANAGKRLLIDTDGLDWNYDSSVVDEQTNVDGVLKIEIRRLRPQVEGAPPLEAKRVTISASLGLVTSSQAVLV